MIADNKCWSNQLSGIVLQRDPQSPDQPSRARIERNRCHDNANSGVVLFSSESEMIADNECWENQRSGIVLERDPQSPDQPSRAIIQRNRCYKNIKAGIALASSEAEEIIDNECWENQLSGILLDHYTKSPDQPSRARIQHNRCHDNTQMGIILLSSESEMIADNKCWSNQLSGIVLQRDPQSPDQPSSSEIQTIVEIILKGGLSRTRPGL
jgi:nitrous oxidase accessory protein NosD